MLCSATLLPDPSRPGPDGLLLQVEAAAAAGFSAISLWELHARAAHGAASDEAVRERVRAAGVGVDMVEALMPWEIADERDALAAAEPTLRLAADYGASRVMAVSMTPSIPPLAVAARRLRRLTERAADLGLALVIEFLPWSGIPDLATAWRLVEEVDRDDVGILLDAWHWQRQPGGPDLDLLRRVPPERLAVLQLCDAPAESSGDLLTECTTARLLPGEGAVDLDALLRTLDEMGARPRIAPEVFSRSLAAAGPHAMAQRIRDATLRSLGRRAAGVSRSTGRR